MSRETYARGFMKVAESHGVDPAGLVKYAKSAKGEAMKRVLNSSGILKMIENGTLTIPESGKIWNAVRRRIGKVFDYGFFKGPKGRPIVNSNTRTFRRTNGDLISDVDSDTTWLNRKDFAAHPERFEPIDLKTGKTVRLDPTTPYGEKPVYLPVSEGPSLILNK